MRTFVDVGAHYGETLEVALDPVWGFDRVLVLEPASDCQPLLRKFRDPRVKVYPVGLGAKDETVSLYGAGQLGASMFASKQQKARTTALKTEKVEVVKASRWFEESIPAEGEVFMKFNCEGAECDILDELLAAGFGPRLTSLYIDFDVRKVPELAHRQREVEQRLAKTGVHYETPESLGRNGNPAVRLWLEDRCQRRSPSMAERVRFRLASYAPAYTRLKMVLHAVLPPRFYNWLGHRFGRMTRASRS